MILFHSGHSGSPPGFGGAPPAAAFWRPPAGGASDAKRGPKSACATLPLLSGSSLSNHDAATAENSARDSFWSASLSPCATSAAAVAAPGVEPPPPPPQVP